LPLQIITGAFIPPAQGCCDVGVAPQAGNDLKRFIQKRSRIKETDLLISIRSRPKKYGTGLVHSH
jgi:hypothetical protein